MPSRLNARRKIMTKVNKVKDSEGNNIDMAKILIVDDSRTSRKLMRNLLEEGGHEVVGEAKDGEEGYLLYKELKPDLVTMDITMPKVDMDKNVLLIKGSVPGPKGAILKIKSAVRASK